MSTAAPLLVYEEDRVRVLAGLREGRLEYADVTSWGFLDKFFALWIDRGFFSWAGQTFPSPRQRHHVPVWVLLAAFTQLKLHTEVAFRRIPYVLQSASILRTLGVQLGVAGGGGGFNRRQKRPRRGPVDQDTVRKFMKDTDPLQLQAWYTVDVVAWLRAQRLFEAEGVDVLDAALVPVPDNPHYEDSAIVPLTPDGHYPNAGEPTVPTRCYKVASLLHVLGGGPDFSIAGSRSARAMSPRCRWPKRWWGWPGRSRGAGRCGCSCAIGSFVMGRRSPPGSGRGSTWWCR